MQAQPGPGGAETVLHSGSANRKNKRYIETCSLGEPGPTRSGVTAWAVRPFRGAEAADSLSTDHSAYAKERPRLPGVFPSLPQSQEGLAMWQEGWGSSLPSRARAEGQRTATDASGHWVRGPEQGQA